MTTENKDSKLLSAVELISSHGFEGMSQSLEILINTTMLVERSRYLQAEPYERAPDCRKKKVAETLRSIFDTSSRAEAVADKQFGRTD